MVFQGVLPPPRRDGSSPNPSWELLIAGRKGLCWAALQMGPHTPGTSWPLPGWPLGSAGADPDELAAVPLLSHHTRQLGRRWGRGSELRDKSWALLLLPDAGRLGRFPLPRVWRCPICLQKSPNSHWGASGVIRPVFDDSLHAISRCSTGLPALEGDPPGDMSAGVEQRPMGGGTGETPLLLPGSGISEMIGCFLEMQWGAQLGAALQWVSHRRSSWWWDPGANSLMYRSASKFEAGCLAGLSPSLSASPHHCPCPRQTLL